MVIIVAYKQQYITSDWTLIASGVVQFVILFSRIYYWRSYSHHSGVSDWNKVVFWKNGTTLTPLVHLG